MDHYRAVHLVVRTLVRQIETLRQIVVDLYRTQLPAASQRILDHEVELRAVECRLAVLDDRIQPLVLRSLDDRALGLIPVLVRTDILLAVVRIAQRHLRRILVELQRAEYVEHDVDDLLELLQQLVGAHEEVGVVLRERSDARQSVQLARLLVAVYRTEFGQTHRKVLVRTRLGTIYLAVVRAVHRFEHILLALDRRMYRLERILAVLGIVARRLVKLDVADMGRDDLLVAVLLLYLAQEAFQAVSQVGALGQPQRQTLTHSLRECKEFQLFAQLAVVALLGLLQHRQILVEHRLLGERNTVYTRQHLVLLVAAPVCAGNRRELQRLDITSVGDMRTAAQVGKRTVRVERYGTVGQIGYQFAFILVALLGKCLQRIGLRHLRAHQRLLLPRQLDHLLLDRRKV